MKRIPRPFTVDIKGGRRHGPIAWPMPQQETRPAGRIHPPEAPAVAASEPWRQARILPALEMRPIPTAAALRPETRDDDTAAPEILAPAKGMQTEHIPIMTLEPVQVPADPPRPADQLAIGVEIIRRVERVAEGPKGSGREGFRRGERWRRRLPPVIRPERTNWPS